MLLWHSDRCHSERGSRQAEAHRSQDEEAARQVGSVCCLVVVVWRHSGARRVAMGMRRAETRMERAEMVLHMLVEQVVVSAHVSAPDQFA